MQSELQPESDLELEWGQSHSHSCIAVAVAVTVTVTVLVEPDLQSQSRFVWSLVARIVPNDPEPFELLHLPFAFHILSHPIPTQLDNWFQPCSTPC